MVRSALLLAAGHGSIQPHPQRRPAVTTENTRSKAQRGREPAPPESVAQPDPVVLQARRGSTPFVWEPVLHALGEPHNLFRVHIQPLRDGSYRMKVYVDTNAAKFKIPYSCFVETDDEGKVLLSSPTIYKLY